MNQELIEALRVGERRIGRRLTNKEFEDAIDYARRKSIIQGNGESYTPLLLPDVISEREYEARSEALAKASLLAEKEKETRWKLSGITTEQLTKIRAVAPELLALAQSAGIA